MSETDALWAEEAAEVWTFASAIFVPTADVALHGEAVAAASVAADDLAAAIRAEIVEAKADLALTASFI